MSYTLNMKEDKLLKRLESTGRLTGKGQSPSWSLRRPFKEWGLILQAVRIATGLTELEFAKLIGVSRATESYYENGIFSPTTDHAKKIAEVVLNLLISKNECIEMLDEVEDEVEKIEGGK